jgi:hypothetical protein
MPYRAKRRQYVAFVLLALAGVVYFARPPAVDIRLWKPLAVPIELKVGKVLTPEFTAGLDTEYLLAVGSERRIEFKRLQCLLGMADWQPDQACADPPEAIDIDWTVLHNGQLAAAGSSKESSGGGWVDSDTVAREIGHFNAQRGERYSIVLYIRRNGGELSMTNPKLLVQTKPWAWADAAEGFAMISALRAIGIAAFAIAGLLTLILTPLFGWAYRWHRRRTAANSA